MSKDSAELFLQCSTFDETSTDNLLPVVIVTVSHEKIETAYSKSVAECSTMLKKCH